MRRRCSTAFRRCSIRSTPRTCRGGNLLVLATGSQGERRAASAQLAQGKYLGFELKAGDTFLFSSKTIPGNEVSVARVLNALSEKGVTRDRRQRRALPRLAAMPTGRTW